MDEKLQSIWRTLPRDGIGELVGSSKPGFVVAADGRTLIFANAAGLRFLGTGAEAFGTAGALDSRVADRLARFAARAAPGEEARELLRLPDGLRPRLLSMVVRRPLGEPALVRVEIDEPRADAAAPTLADSLAPLAGPAGLAVIFDADGDVAAAIGDHAALDDLHDSIEALFDEDDSAPIERRFGAPGRRRDVVLVRLGVAADARRLLVVRPVADEVAAEPVAVEAEPATPLAEAPAQHPHAPIAALPPTPPAPIETEATRAAEIAGIAPEAGPAEPLAEAPAHPEAEAQTAPPLAQTAPTAAPAEAVATAESAMAEPEAIPAAPIGEIPALAGALAITATATAAPAAIVAAPSDAASFGEDPFDDVEAVLLFAPMSPGAEDHEFDDLAGSIPAAAATAAPLVAEAAALPSAIDAEAATPLAARPAPVATLVVTPTPEATSPASDIAVADLVTATTAVAAPAQRVESSVAVDRSTAPLSAPALPLGSDVAPIAAVATVAPEVVRAVITPTTVHVAPGATIADIDAAVSTIAAAAPTDRVPTTLDHAPPVAVPAPVDAPEEIAATAEPSAPVAIATPDEPAAPVAGPSEAHTAPTTVADADVHPTPVGTGNPSDDAATAIKEDAANTTAEDASEASTFAFAPLDRAVKFVWQMDADRRFTLVSEELAAAVGPAAAAVVGLTWSEVARRWGLDGDGRVAAALDRRDTWSGRTVLWPIEGEALRLPIDLAALPAFDRGRVFAGFRGFGTCRAEEIVPDPTATGRRLAAEAARVTPTVDAPAAPADDRPAPIAPAMPETPAASVVPAEIDTVERLAEIAPLATAAAPVAEIAPLASADPDAAPAPVPAPEQPAGDAPAIDRSEPPAWPGDGESAGVAHPHEPARPDGGDGGDGAFGGETGEPVTRAPDAPEIAGRTPTDESTSVEAPAAAPIATAAPTLNERPPERAAEVQATAPLPATSLAPSEPHPITEPPHATLSPNVPAAPPPLPSAAGPAAVSAIAAALAARLGPETTAAPPTPSSDAAGAASAAATGAAASAAEPVTRLSPPERVAFRQIAEVLGSRIDPANRSGETAADTRTAESSARPAPSAAVAAPAAPAPVRQPLRPATPPPRVAAGFDARLLDRLPLAVAIVKDDDVVYANERYLSLLGYPDLATFRDEGGLDALFAGAHAARRFESGDTGRPVPLLARDGTVVPVDAVLSTVPWADASALMMTLTAFKPAPIDAPAAAPVVSPTRTEPAPIAPQTVDTRVAELEAIVDTATDGVLVLDAEGLVLSANAAAEALFGTERREMIGRPFTERLAPESRRSILDYLDGLARNGVASVLNDGREVIGVVRPEGLIPLFLTIGRISVGTGHKYCAVLRDITQWKKAEEDLTAARRRAEEASVHKSDFLAKISHEIRTPLNAIIGFSEVMMDERFGPVGNERYKDYLRDIHVSGTHIMSLVNDLLDLSKVEAGKMDLRFEAVAIGDIVSECVAMMQPQANRERIIIRSSLPAGVPAVVADPRSVRQVVLNLLSNAIKFTPAGGQVIVSTSLEDNGEVVLRVRDTGYGMTDKELQTAMEPFRQLHTTRTRAGGTGLGLPLTKALVEANRAMFRIDSTVGQGTLVSIAFPVTRVLAS